MKYHTIWSIYKTRITALIVWALLILLTRYGGWYEDSMPKGVVIIPSWPKTIIGTSIVMLIALRLRKLYWSKLMNHLEGGSND